MLEINRAKEEIGSKNVHIYTACTEGKNRSVVAAQLLKMQFPKLENRIEVLPDGLNGLQKFLGFELQKIIAPNAELHELNGSAKKISYKKFMRKAENSILLLVISDDERRCFSEVISFLEEIGFEVAFLEAHGVEDVFKGIINS